MGAYEHVRVLSVDIGPRPTGSVNCHKGAEYIHEQLNKINMETKVHHFKVHPSFWSGTAFFGLLFSIMIALTFFELPVIALSLSILYPTLVMLEVDIGIKAAIRILPSAKAMNVIGIEKPLTSKKQQVIICAHYDSKTQAIPLRLRSFVFLLIFVVMIVLILSTLFNVIISLFLSSMSDISSLLYFGVLFSVAYQSLYFAMNIATRFVEQSPGAEDNAASVGTSLELAKLIRQQPLRNTELWFLYTDAEEIAMEGAQVFVKEYRDEISDAMIINLEGGGTAGQITYSLKEKSVRSKKSSEKLITYLKEASEASNEPIRPMPYTTSTDGYVFARNGYESITIWRYNEKVRDVVHTSKDTIDRLDPEILTETVDFLYSVLKHIDGSV